MARRRERIDRPTKVLSDDVYALASTRHLAYLIAPRIVPVAVLGTLLLVVGPYPERILAIAAIYALLALSWDFLAGTTGLISLGQALFFGLGAYFTGIFNVYAGVPPLASIVLATLAGAGASAILLVPCLPLRGVYFSMTTLVYPLLMARLIEATGAFGGTDGLVGIAPLPIRGWEAAVAVGVVLTATFGLRRFVSTDTGVVLRAIGEDDIAAQAAGIAITKYRIVAVLIASGLGSLAGAYFTHLYMFVGMSSFALDLSILPIAAAAIGGMGTLTGPVLGAFLLVPLSEAARDLGALRIVLYSSLLAAVIVARPEGLVPFLRRKYQQRERWVEV